MWGTVGSLTSSDILGPSTWVQFPLDPLDLFVQLLSASYVYTFVLANQTIHRFGVGKLVPAICRGNSALRSVRGGEGGG